MKAASSVHLQGTITKAGKAITIDASVFSNGDVSGSFSEAGPSIGIIKIGSTDYVKTTAAFYEAKNISSSIANLMGGSWIEIPDSSAGLGSDFSLATISNSISTDHGTLSAGTTSTVDGMSVVSVNSSKGGTLYVATSGTPYPVKLAGSSVSSGTGTISFTLWNQAKIPTVPKGARTPASFG